MFDTKLKLRYLLSDSKIWLEKSGFVSVRNETKQRTTDPGSRLVDPVDDEDVEEIRSPDFWSSNVWQCDLKKMEEY
jgi:hypothetical protein